MELNNFHRDELYIQASETQRFLYSSPLSGHTLFIMGKKYFISTSDDYKKFAILIGDIILGFYKIEDTVPLLQQELGIDAKTAALLGADVLDFLAPLSDPNWQPPTEVEDVIEMDTISNPAVQTFETNVTHTIEQPSTPIPVAETIPEYRTMAGDMDRSPARSSFNPIPAANDEPVYKSTQTPVRTSLSDTPSYNAPLYNAPKPTPDAPLEKPRWG